MLIKQDEKIYYMKIIGKFITPWLYIPRQDICVVPSMAR